MFKNLKQIINFSGRHKKEFIISLFYNIIFVCFEVLPLLAIIYSLQNILATINDHSKLDSKVVLNIFFLMLASVVGQIIFGSVANSKMTISCFNMCNDKRIEIGNKLKKIPMGYFSENSLGELTSIVTNTLTETETLITHTLNNIITGLLHIVITAIVITFFDWHIGLVAFIAFALGLVTITILQHQSEIVSPKRQEAQNNLITAVLEYVQGISVIKAFGLSKSSNKTVDNAIDESCKKNIRLEAIFTKIVSFYIYIFKLASCATIFISLYEFSTGKFSMSLTFMTLVTSFVMFSKIEKVGELSSVLNMINYNINKVNSIYKIPLLDESGSEINPENHNIEFKNVSFSYGNKTILKDINFSIKEKETVAIVGHSGSGKTTICNLLSRFWDIDNGEIKLGGVNIKNYTCDSLLSNISTVSQKVYLFQDTVLNNIRFARPDASLKEVINAANQACCHEFITKLPNSYDTVIGEGGSSLSGGEKQRISIARAILKNAPIIILDEATSSVDPENQLQLQNAITSLTKDKTVIMVAHRLSTIEQADKIFVVNDGKIIQNGKHEVLCQEEGLYKDFVNIRKRSLSWNL